MISKVFTSFLLTLWCWAAVAEQTIVLPAVSDDVAGVHGSRWVTELQIIKSNPSDDVVIQRTWVCLPEGGFADAPQDAPKWEMTGSGAGTQILQLSGADLLVGSGSSLGAVGLQVIGGQVFTSARIIDASNGGSWGGTPFGQGQLIVTDTEPLTDESYIPWLGGCLTCDENPSQSWEFLRSNIGLVNPNPRELTITGTVRAFGNDVPPEWGHVASGVPVELSTSGVGSPERFQQVVPAFGWIQFPWRSSASYVYGFWQQWRIPNIGFMVTLNPDPADIPYYAYSSVVFTPDPASGMPAFNDPMFIAAEPGFIEPYWDYVHGP